MSEFNNDKINEFIELKKYYEVLEQFISKYNKINYVDFDYNIVHNFTLFIVDPDFDFNVLNQQISRILKALPAVKRIFTKPVLHLTEKDEIVPIEAVKKINNDTINHISRHSELWDDVDAKSGIKPLKLLTKTYQDNYGIYENLVFCKTIDDILYFARKNMKIIKNFHYVNQSMEFDLLERVNHLDYFLALGKLHTGYIRNFEKYRVISKRCLNGLINIHDTIVPRLNKPVYLKNKARPTKLKKTNILAMHREYKHIYSLQKYFMNNKIELNNSFTIEDYKNLLNNYVSFCSILSIFSIGHFNFTCSKDTIFDFNNLDCHFKFKGWELSIKHEIIDDIKVIVFNINKNTSYRICVIPTIDLDKKDDILENFKDKENYNELYICMPFEKYIYPNDEICIDISNLESFRRIQQLLLRAMIYSDNERVDCPFCLHNLELLEDDNIKKYQCEGCKTLIVDTICNRTGKRYSYTNIDGYEPDELNVNKFKYEKWLYYRKKEALLHYRNITKLDEDDQLICPHCNSVHD